MGIHHGLVLLRGGEKFVEGDDVAAFRIFGFFETFAVSDDAHYLFFDLFFLAEDRDDVIIALGGGVVGDLAGFVSSTYLRGIKFVQIPTTLLAAVDSSVGGKTAIDLKAGKNLAGAFYQPQVVLCDYSTLDTLPEEVFNDGCAEVIKYGVIASEELFEKCFKGIKENIEDIIYECVRIKRDIVAKDEFDIGMRQLLNYGHTIGHAIEACSNYEITHGSAVAIGMILITKAAVKLDICGENTLIRLEKLIKLCGLPYDTHYGVSELYEIMLSDKKVDEKPGTVLPYQKSIGIEIASLEPT